MQEFTGVFWMDTSVKLIGALPTSLYNRSMKTSGHLQFIGAKHSTYAVTSPQTYTYLPVDVTLTKTKKQMAAGAVLFHRTKTTHQRVLLPWLACALTEQCIAPIMDTNCHFEEDLFNQYVGCHRFDQSALNIITLNEHPSEDYNDVMMRNILVARRRQPGDIRNLTFCNGEMWTAKLCSDNIKGITQPYNAPKSAFNIIFHFF